MSRSRLTLLTGLALASAAVLGAPRIAAAQRSRCRAHEVDLTPPEGQVAVNGTTPILVTTYDAAGNVCDNLTYVWASSNPSVATVDRNGTVRGVSLGTTTITARTGTGSTAKTGHATVTVVDAEVVNQAAPSPDTTAGHRPRAHGAGQGQAALDYQPDGSGQADVVNVDPVQMQLIRGERQQLVYRALKTDGSAAQPVPIVFQVSPGGERVAGVDSFGFVQALGEAGSATITLTVPNQSRIQPRIVAVEVRNDSVRFSRPTVVMAPGDTMSLSPFVPNQRRALAPTLFQFNSTDPSKVTVTPGGLVTAVAAGTARVVARNAYVPEFAAVVNIHRRVRAVTLTPTDRPTPPDSMVVIPIGGSITLRAAALAAEDNSPVPDAPITWTIQDIGQAVQADTARGVFRGARSGVATVRISTLISGETQAMASLRVKVVAGGLASPRTRIGLGVGETTTVNVALLDEQRNNAGSANAFLSWTSDSTARIDNGNRLVALRAGHTRLVGRAGWDSTITLDVFVVPDMLVIGRQGGRQGVLALNAAGQMLGFKADSLVEFVAWAPDLTAAAVTEQANVQTRTPGAVLVLSDADGEHGVRLTDDSLVARYPVFVPGVTGGYQIVFEWNKGGRAQIWKIGVQNGRAGAPEQLTNMPTAANLTPTVSPDGRRLAYVSVRQTSPGRPTYGLYTAGIDGSGEHLVISMPQGHNIYGAPVFTPDGQSLLFVRSEPQRLPTQRVMRVSVAAGPTDTAAAVTPLDMVVRSFSMSADGQTLALNTLEPLANGGFNPHLVLFGMTGGARQPIDPPDMRPANPAFRPATPAAPAASH